MKDLGIRRLRRCVPVPCSTFIVTVSDSRSSCCLLNNLASTPSKPTEQKRERSMKKALITVTAMTLLGAGIPRAQAHGSNGAAVAAGVIGGIGAGIIISEALRPHPVYVAPAPVVVQQPTQVVYQQPQPVFGQQPTQVVTAAPQQVVVQQPVLVQQPAVVYAPAPVVYPAPVYVRPVYAPPVVTFGFRFGGGHGHYHRHW